MADPVGDIPREWQLFLLELTTLHIASLFHLLAGSTPADAADRANAFSIEVWPLIDPE